MSSIAEDQLSGTATAPALRISAAGEAALLIDAAGKTFDASIQTKIWAMADLARSSEGVIEVVPGMNNLLVRFDPLERDRGHVETALRLFWNEVLPAEIAGREFSIPVTYGGPQGEDLAFWSEHCGLSVPEAVRLHSTAVYSVAAIGAMPGFPYLSGLDPRLACPRRGSPRLAVREGSVIIGGAQTAIMPQTGPSGWHIIGKCEARLFEPLAEPPTLLKAGDTVRFTVTDILR